MSEPERDRYQRTPIGMFFQNLAGDDAMAPKPPKSVTPVDSSAVAGEAPAVPQSEPPVAVVDESSAADAPEVAPPEAPEVVPPADASVVVS